MTIELPKSMDECVYFSNRSLENGGKAKAWARKVMCPECNKGLMGKPVVKGKVKIRATEYECPECKFTEAKAEHETRLKVEVLYTCPECHKEGEGECAFKRKSFKGVPAYIVVCEHCGSKIGITKRMKIPKKK